MISASSRLLIKITLLKHFALEVRVSILYLLIQKSTGHSCMITYRMQFFKFGPLPQKHYRYPTMSLCKHKRYTALLFNCRYYQVLSNTLLNVSVTYQGPSLNLLFDRSTLSLETNIAIFEQVHKYYLTFRLL